LSFCAVSVIGHLAVDADSLIIKNFIELLLLFRLKIDAVLTVFQTTENDLICMVMKCDLLL
jgi:hypothetical protein